MNTIKTAYRWLVRIMVNLRFAVILIGAITLYAAAATIAGAVYGEDVQMELFRAAPFTALMGVFTFALALACASRWPWKRTQIGFLATHAGLIVIVFGHLVTAHLGLEGRLDLFEGESARAIEQDDWALSVDLPGEGKRVFVRAPLGLPADRPLDRAFPLPNGETLRVLRYFPTYDERVVAERGDGPPAVKVAFRRGKRVATEWLAPDGAATIDALRVTYRRLPDAAALEAAIAPRRGPARLLALSGDEILLDAEVDAALVADQPVGDGGHRLRVRRRFERFRLVDEQPAEGEDGPLNPALLVEVTHPDGAADLRWVFAAHGEIAARDARPLPFALRYDDGSAAGAAALAGTASLSILEAPGREPVILATAPDGSHRAAPLAIGTPLPLPWAGGEATVLERLASARLRREPWCSSTEPRRPALLVSRSRAPAGASAAWVVWTPDDRPTAIDGPGGPLLLRYGPRRVPLPFTIELKDFILETYEGTESPMSFESIVRVIPHDGRPAFDCRIYMNNPLRFEGYTFFQSSYDPESLRRSIFQVSYDPGWPIVYAGYALLTLGLLFVIHVKPILLRREAARRAAAGLARAAAAAAAIVLAVALPARAEPADDPHAAHRLDPAPIASAPEPLAAFDGKLDLAPLRDLAVQDGGRRKPLDTFARERVKQILGTATHAGRNPLETLLSMIFEADRWTSVEALKIANLRLVSLFGKTKNVARLSIDEIDRSPAFRDALMAIDPHAKDLGAFEKAVVELDWRRRTFFALARGLRIAPAPGASEKAAWSSIVDLDGQAPAVRAEVFEALRASTEAWRAGDAKLASASLARLADQVRRIQAPIAPPAWKLRLETALNRWQPLRIAYGVLIFAALFLGTSAVTGGRKSYFFGSALLAAGLIVSLAALAARTLIVERAPVSNLYEASAFTVVMAVLVGAIFEASHRTAVFGTLGAVFGALGSLLIDVAGMDASIQPLVPVLRSYWLNLHVTAMLISYATFAIAFLLGIVWFAKWFPARGLPRATIALPVGIAAAGVGLLLRRGATHEVPSILDYLVALVIAPGAAVGVAWPLVRIFGADSLRPGAEAPLHTLERAMHRACMVGFGVLTIGIILGAVWANESWGRYWGWDPKETWAFVTWMMYAAYVHGRIAGWFRGAASAIFPILGFYAVLFTFYGVSYVLPGLHSYLKS